MSAIYGLASVGTVVACPALFLVLVGATPWASDDDDTQRVVKAREVQWSAPESVTIISDAQITGPELSRDPFYEWGPVIPIEVEPKPASKKPAAKAASQVKRSSKPTALPQRAWGARRSPWDALMAGSRGGSSMLGRYQDRLFGSDRYNSSVYGSGMRNNPYSGRISRSAQRFYYRKWYE